ncbi:hypothetical protein BDZ85DRAFT_317799 [Elsinoe ampelina]|uniref:Uncharacterized protein n=1 Tax=Elsinoe ampelina TaxID=302913 RepID=A0A6A6GHS3_9PEZI|nr:hypothetical protein BDZ85DRAFT_317799 [Elsinoe ampelina]
MATSSVLRIRRTDAGDGDYVIARVEQSKSGRLDLLVYATDGEQVYLARLKHTEIESLQSKTGKTSLEDWHNVLSAKLLQTEGDLSSKVVQDIELVASISDNMTLTFRKNIGKITQRLGDVVLKPNDDVELSILDWTAESAAKVATLQDRTSSLESQLREQQQQVAELKKQLDDAAQHQRSEQELLIQEFAALLNTKKLKIRDQQRQLLRAGIDPNDHRSSAQRPAANGSKRKAAADTNDRDEDGDGEENAGEEDADMSDATQRTESPEPEDDDGLDQVINQREAVSEQETTSQRSDGKKQPDADLTKIPPRRELPFAQSNGHSTKARPVQKGKSPIGADDDETDDEL